MRMLFAGAGAIAAAMLASPATTPAVTPAAVPRSTPRTSLSRMRVRSTGTRPAASMCAAGATTGHALAHSLLDLHVAVLCNREIVRTLVEMG